MIVLFTPSLPDFFYNLGTEKGTICLRGLQWADYYCVILKCMVTGEGAKVTFQSKSHYPSGFFCFPSYLSIPFLPSNLLYINQV